MTKFIPITIIMLFTLTMTSCTRSLTIPEDLDEDLVLIHQGNLSIQSIASDSISFSNDELYPDPDIPIKDTHDWKIKP